MDPRLYPSAKGTNKFAKKTISAITGNINLGVDINVSMSNVNATAVTTTGKATPGQIYYIDMAGTGGVANHVVTFSGGVKVNNLTTLTFNADAEAVVMQALSPTDLRVIVNTGAVGIS
jgi:hypothetical protein